MPFGTRITTDGVHFRLWAPGCDRVSLRITDEGHEPAHARVEPVIGPAATYRT